MKKTKAVNGAAKRTAKTPGQKLLADLEKHGITIDEVKRELDKAIKATAKPAKEDKEDKVIFDLSPPTKAEMADWHRRYRAYLKSRDDRRAKTVPITIQVQAWAYGLLGEAAVMNDCSIDEALDGYIHGGDNLCEWCNNDCPMDRSQKKVPVPPDWKEEEL